MAFRSAFSRLLLISILSWGYSLADKTVYLDRSVDANTWEPRFIPKTINAAIGEQVHFVLRLQPLILPVRLLLFDLPILTI